MSVVTRGIGVALVLGCIAHGASAGDALIPAEPSSAYLSELAQMNMRYELLEESAACFDRALPKAQSDDERGRIAFSLSQVLMRLQRPEAATNALVIAMAAKPEDVPFQCQCHTFLAQCLLRMGQSDAAEASLRYVMQNSVDDWEKTHARDQLFTLLAQSGRGDELVKTLGEQMGTDTNNPALLLELASAYALQTNGQETALGLYNQVLEEDPGNKEALERTIAIYRSTGRFKDAVSLVQRLFDGTEDADRKKELADRAATLCRMGGEVADALAWQSKAAELDPESPVPLVKLADTYASQSDWTNAITSYQSAVSKARTDGERDTFALMLIDAQLRADKAQEAEAGMKALAETGTTEQVRAKAKRMLFDFYEKQGRLGEISFPSQTDEPIAK